MRRILLVIICILSILALVSCEEANSAPMHEYGVNDYKRFIRIYEHKHNGFEIYVDTDTNVQYLRDVTSDGVEWIVLVDTDGKPLLYERE